MLSTILWVIGGLILLGILYFAFKIFFVVTSVKKVLNVVREEVENLPKDYQSVRKEVVNENSSVGAKMTGTAKQVAKTGWRWFWHR